MASLLASVIGAEAHAAPSSVWSPTGKWNVEFADQQCLATRSFADGANSLTVAINPTPASDEARLWFFVPDAKARLETARVLVGGQPITASGTSFEGLSASKQRIYAVKLEAEEYGRLLHSGSLTVQASRLNASLALTSLEPLRSLLDSCNADLLKEWGFPQAAELSVFPKPLRPIVDYVSSDDYPSSAVHDDAGGTARIMVTVGTDGRAKECRVLRSSGHEALDKTTCAVLVQRARYTPARDKNGTLVEAPYTGQLRWVMP